LPRSFLVDITPRVDISGVTKLQVCMAGDAR